MEPIELKTTVLRANRAAAEAATNTLIAMESRINTNPDKPHIRRVEIKEPFRTGWEVQVPMTVPTQENPNARKWMTVLRYVTSRNPSHPKESMNLVQWDSRFITISEL